MALLEDPTIQRILDEVNKAASGGMLGASGNYTSEPIEAISEVGHQSLQSGHENYYPQEEAPLFYPTPDMFNMSETTNFDNNFNLKPMPSMIPMTVPSNFDHYSTNLYNTIPQAFISPYESFNGMIKSASKHSTITNKQNPTTSTVSSVNNEMIIDHYRHVDCSTVSPTKFSSAPNLDLNSRTVSQLESAPIDIVDSNDIQIIVDQINNPSLNAETVTTTTTANSKPETQQLPPINNDEADPEHINSAGKIFYDPNPQIIQRKGSHSVTYKQNIIVRFLQPPPVPNAGPLVIKEVPGKQQPPLPPLVIKQRPTPPKTPPPLIIREKPPPIPSVAATKVITRQLPPEPAPPRAVIIERLPPLPNKPRDIIIERWLPYEVINQKRKVIVQRAQKTAKEQQPRNVIITYEPVHAKIVRNFQKQNVIREDPQQYIKQFGPQLHDTNILIQKARSFGVFEDLQPPSTYQPSMTNTTDMGTDYELHTTIVDEQQQDVSNIEKNEKLEEKYNTTEQHDNTQQVLASPAHIDDNIQEEDVLVEENVTPFYMNSGEDLQQTLHRLGINLSETNMK